MKNTLILGLALVCGLFSFNPAVHAQANPAATPESRNSWMEKHELFNLVLKKNKGKFDTAFLGDSITEGWRGRAQDVWDKTFSAYKPFNLGIGGDRTENVLWRIDNGMFDEFQPKALVLMIGTNNLSKKHTPEQTAEGVRAIVDDIHKRSPGTKIIVMGILPRGQSATDPMRALVQQTNELVKKMAEEKGLAYLDIGPKLLESDGSITKDTMPDFLHPTKRGYEAWAEAVAPVLAADEKTTSTASTE
ncbi:MAG: GDSL-type esterase/lipase family protein [Verrucomicrobium sp.]|nr:GDSL-type esterase/lipase family protein [Verrucomicrobium sp.]